MTPFQSPTTKRHTIDRSRIQRPASTRLHLPSSQKPPDQTPPMYNAHPMPPPNRPQVLGIHHWKFAVSNLSLSLAWYERVLGAHRISSLDHFRNDGSRFAVICEMKDWAGVFLELRENAVKALDDRAWDPVTLAVRKRRDLEVWCRWLDACGTRHSAILTGMRGWLVVFEDPDGRRIRLYSQEDHGGKEKPSHDQQWLDDI